MPKPSLVRKKLKLHEMLLFIIRLQCMVPHTKIQSMQYHNSDNDRFSIFSISAIMATSPAQFSCTEGPIASGPGLKPVQIHEIYSNIFKR